MPPAADGWIRSPRFVTDPLVSAIVPVYGAARFMRGLLADLAAQTIADRVEILVVDTGSPTDEGAIVRELQGRIANVAYLRIPERETNCEAANRAVRASRGRYLTLAMSDDRHRPDALERLVAALEAHPDVDLAYADSAVTLIENATPDTAPVVGHFRWPDFDPRLLFECCYVGPQPVYRRWLHDRFGLYDRGYAGACDYEFWLRLVAQGVRFQHVPEVLGLYLLNPGGAEHGNRALTDRDSERARAVHWPASWGARPAPGRSYLMPVSSAARAAMQGAPVASATPAAVPPSRPAAPTGVGERWTDGAGAVRAAPVARPRAAPAADGPLVSVIVPTRDRPVWLRRAVASVLAQTLDAVEVVVVNDGGADVSMLLADLDGDRRVVGLRLPRSRERSAARNAGLALARGRYVAYLDDDDWLEPDHLARLAAALEASGDRIAYGDVRMVREERRGEAWVATGVAEVPPQAFDVDRLLVGNYLPICSVLHRRDCLDVVGGFDEGLHTHEDWDLWIRLALRWPFRHVPGVGANVSWREDGSSTTSREPADFVRTCALVHGRYADEAWRRPGVCERQAQYLAGMHARLPVAPVPTSAAAVFACTVVLPVAGDDAELVRQCVTRLARVTDAPAWELVVVADDDVGPTVRAVLAGISGDVRVLETGDARGFVAACQRGAAAARTPYVAFLAPGTIPREGWLAALTAAAERDARVHVVGSLLVDPDGTVRHAGLVEDTGGRLVALAAGRSAAAPEVQTMRAVAAVALEGMLVRRVALLAAGGLDATFAPGFEAVDLCRRVRARGGTVVIEPGSTLYDLGGVTAAELAAAAAAMLGGRAAEAAPEEGTMIQVTEETGADGYAARASAALVEGDRVGATEALAALFAIAPEHGEGRLVEGVLAVQDGDWAAAERAFAVAGTHGGDPRRARLGLGMALLAQERAVDAWRLFGELAEAHPDDAEIVHWLLRAGCVLECWTELADRLAVYLRHRPDDAAVRFALAGVHVRSGTLQAARIEYEALRTGAPDFAGLGDLARALVDAERAVAAPHGTSALGAHGTSR